MFATIRAMFARKPAAPVSPAAKTRPQWLSDFDAKARAHGARIKAENAAYEANKPARVLAAMQRLADSGELESLAARYGNSPADLTKARARLAARGVSFN